MKHSYLTKITIIAFLAITIISCKSKPTNNVVSNQKQVVEKYIEGLRSTDRSKILSCVNDDVVWEMPGLFNSKGKQAFDKELDNPNADGHPDISITRLIEEGSIVIAEGNVKTKMKDGNTVNAVFCNVFNLTNNKISKLTSYVVFNNDSTKNR